VACYYGCLLVRPPKITGVKEVENPRQMEQIVTLLGGQPVHWTMATECCGASFALSRVSTVLRQGRILYDSARQAGAEVFCVACPMCHANLDMRQGEMGIPPAERLPVIAGLQQPVGCPVDALHADPHRAERVLIRELELDELRVFLGRQRQRRRRVGVAVDDLGAALDDRSLGISLLRGPQFDVVGDGVLGGLDGTRPADLPGGLGLDLVGLLWVGGFIGRLFHEFLGGQVFLDRRDQLARTLIEGGVDLVGADDPGVGHEQVARHRK